MLFYFDFGPQSRAIYKIVQIQPQVQNNFANFKIAFFYQTTLFIMLSIE